MSAAPSRRFEEPRVVHVVPTLFAPDGGLIGGAERYALELARHMAVRTPTTLVSFGAKDREETIDSLTVRIIGGAWHVGGSAFNPLSWKLVPHLLSADVIHCHQTHILASSLSAVLARLTGRRVVATELGGGGWDLSAFVSTDRLFDAHLHLSEYSRRIEGHADLTRAHVVYAGIDTSKFSPPPGGAQRGPVVYAGRVLPHKGVNYLIEALDADMSLEIAGRATDERHLGDLQQLAQGKRVSFLSHCDDAALAAVYGRALCIVLPSVYQTMYGVQTSVPELLGQTLLEGMACGAPALATNVASLPEVVEDGVSGFLVPPNDPSALRDRLRWYRDHPREAETMGVAARQRVLEKFTWPAVVARCLRAYANPSEARNVA